MNKQQRDYAMSRVQAIAIAKIEEIRKKHTKPGIQLTPEERYQALVKGEFKVRKSIVRIHPNTDVEDAVTFNAERETTRDAAKIEAETEKVVAEATRIKDQLMLGDSEAALAMIEAFSK